MFSSLLVIWVMHVNLAVLILLPLPVSYGLQAEDPMSQKIPELEDGFMIHAPHDIRRREVSVPLESAP